MNSSGKSSKAAGASANNAFYCPDNYVPNDSVGYLMRRIISMVGQGVERELESTGLTNAQWVPVLKIHMGVASTAAELARECDLDAGSETRLLGRHRPRSRQRHSRDFCRVQNVHLTGFSAEEWQTLTRYRAIKNIAASPFKACPNGTFSVKQLSSHCPGRSDGVFLYAAGHHHALKH